MEEIFNIISENKNTLESKNKIIEIFHNLVNDLSKEELLEFIEKIIYSIKNNTQTDLLIRVLPEILSFSESYYEDVSSIISNYNFANYFKKKYNKIDVVDIDLFCSYNYLLEVLKKINAKQFICKNTKKSKLFNKIQSKYYIILNEVEDLNNIYGLDFYKSQLQANMLFPTKNDKLFIKEYYKKYSQLIKKDNKLFNKMINEDLFIYIMQLNTFKFAKEIQEYLNIEFKDYFEKLNLEQIKYRQEFINGKFDNMEAYSHIYNISGNIISDNIANYILNLAFNSNQYVKEESITMAIRSLAYYYLKALNIDDYSIVIKNPNDMNFNRGSHRIYPSKVININKILIKSFLKTKNLTLFVTLFHELEHAKQKQKNSNYFEYQMQKEEILIRNQLGYYFDNYEFLLSELDARLNGTICLIRYLEQLIPESVELYKDKLLQSIKEENTSLEQFNNETIYSFGDEIDAYFSKLVKENSSIIKNNPIFKLEYNLNGKLKSDYELLESYQSLNEKDKLIIKEIIKVRLNTDLNSLLDKLQIPFKQNEIYFYYMNILSKNIIENINLDEQIINYLYSIKNNLFASLIIDKIHKKTKK